MPADLGDATLKLEADAKALTKGIAEVQKSTTKRLAGIGKTLTKTLTPAALGIGAAVFTSSETINDAFATIRTGTGATGEALQDLQRDFEDVYGSVPGDSQAVASALAEVHTRLQSTGADLQAVTRTALEMAAATGGDATTAITQTVQAMRIFDAANEDAVKTMDKIFVASQQTGIGVSDLTTQLQTYGPVLRNANFSMDEATAIFANLNAAGVDASRVFPGLNAYFRKVADSGGDMRREFAEVVEEIKSTTSQTEALNIATAAFGAEGAQRLVVAIQDGAFELDAMVTSLENAEGSIVTNAEATRTMTERMTMLRQEIGEKLAGAFRGLPDDAQIGVAALGGLAAAIGPLLVALPGLTLALAKFRVGSLLSEAAVWASRAAMLLWNGIMAIVARATRALTAAQAALNIVMAVNPFALAVIAIASLALVILALTTDFEDLKVAIDAVWEALKQIPDAASKLDPIDVAVDFFRGHEIAGFIGNSFSSIGGILGLGGDDPRKMAGGGIVTQPTLTQLGEEGPEAVIPLSDAMMSGFLGGRGKGGGKERSGDEMMWGFLGTGFKGPLGGEGMTAFLGGHKRPSGGGVLSALVSTFMGDLYAGAKKATGALAGGTGLVAALEETTEATITVSSESESLVDWLGILSRQSLREQLIGDLTAFVRLIEDQVDPSITGWVTNLLAVNPTVEELQDALRSLKTGWGDVATAAEEAARQMEVAAQDAARAAETAAEDVAEAVQQATETALTIAVRNTRKGILQIGEGGALVPVMGSAAQQALVTEGQKAAGWWRDTDGEWRDAIGRTLGDISETLGAAGVHLAASGELITKGHLGDIDVAGLTGIGVAEEEDAPPHVVELHIAGDLAAVLDATIDDGYGGSGSLHDGIT